jgi:predicted Fe-Mo cluster-binding NifX family protein
MKVAIPLEEGVLASHFGRCQEFAIIDLDTDSRQIIVIETKVPPAHQPGIFPEWLNQLGVSAVIAGGMGHRAIQLFTRMGIDLYAGAPVDTPENLARSYLEGTLHTEFIPCEGGHGGCDHDHQVQ